MLERETASERFGKSHAIDMATEGLQESFLCSPGTD